MGRTGDDDGKVEWELCEGVRESAMYVGNGEVGASAKVRDGGPGGRRRGLC